MQRSREYVSFEQKGEGEKRFWCYLFNTRFSVHYLRYVRLHAIESRYVFLFCRLGYIAFVASTHYSDPGAVEVPPEMKHYDSFVDVNQLNPVKQQYGPAPAN